MEKGMEEGRVRVSASEAEKIYSTGGKITVTYTFVSPNGECEREANFQFIDCGFEFDYIKSIYRVSNIKNITYYVNNETMQASNMCDLMCN